jgi:ZIP family zinc transporter
MILVSFSELLAQAVATVGFVPAHIFFFIGLLVMFGIDSLVSHKYIVDNHDVHKDHHGKLMKTSLLVALGIGIHNFPEGVATFVATLSDLKLGIALAIAIAIHNIPEGIAIAVPVYAATKSRKKAFFWSFISGVSEPIGALVAALILLPFINETVIAWTLAMVAGFMVYIAFDELLPVSRQFGHEHLSIVGVIMGMAVMALSLTLI